MLKSLYISNYALISELNICFDAGFSVLTGETGAGKSIIVGALSLIMGQRADTRAIREGADKCVVEVEFDISAYRLADFFAENELDYSENQCIIRREINMAGKSRAFVNDTPASLAVLRELSAMLIDIHSQHENLELGKDVYQRELLDNFAQNQIIRENYLQAFEHWKNAAAELQKTRMLVQKKMSDLDYLQFQYQQLVDFQLIDGEQETLEQELETLNHAEEIKTELVTSANLLNNNEISVYSQLKDTLSSLNKIKNYLAEGENLYNRTESVFIELKDISHEINIFAEKTEFNPARLEQVETRLSDLYGLQKKFNAHSAGELIEKRDDMAAQLLIIENFEEKITELERALTTALTALEKHAKTLTESRVTVSKSIEKTLIAELVELGIAHAQVKIDISPLPDFAEHGGDRVEILFSANRNRAPQPIAVVASGGEISRLMLAVKYLLAGKISLPTIVFDEIDTGVSGDIADRVGRIMQRMSGTMQVFAITHLPQIAARGDRHFRVFKAEECGEVATHIVALSPEERVGEIAQMLSGTTVSASAVANAQELLQKGKC